MREKSKFDKHEDSDIFDEIETMSDEKSETSESDPPPSGGGNGGDRSRAISDPPPGGGGNGG